MSTEQKILDIGVVAGEDLSDDQYRFVVLDANGVRRPNSETEVALGILQNAPESGHAASVRIIGISKLEVNDALGVGDFVMPEYVDAADAGKGKDASGALQYARGYVMEASSAEGDLASVLLLGMVPGINDAVQHVTTVTTDNTAGANTYSAAELIGGLVLRDPAGASRSDVSPDAADIVAGIAGAIIGSSFEFTIRNTADAAEVITLTAGTGVTLSGTMTIAQGYARRFLAVCTNVTAEAEAVTIYNLGAAPNDALVPTHKVFAAGIHTEADDADGAFDITVTGALDTDIAVAVLASATNDVYLKTAVSAAGKISVALSAAGGADTIVHYALLRASS